MQMNTVPSANEFIDTEEFYAVTSGDTYEITRAMIKFAKLHVKAALKNASTFAESAGEAYIILNSYPDELIK